MHHDADLSLAAEQFDQRPCREPAGFDVIRRDIADVLRGVEAGIEDGHRNIRSSRPFDRGNQRLPLRSRNGDAVHVLRNHGVHDLDLPAEVRLAGRSIPENLDIEFAARIERALLDRQPEHVRRCLRDDGDRPLAFAGAPGKPREPQCRDTLDC